MSASPSLCKKQMLAHLMNLSLCSDLTFTCHSIDLVCTVQLIYTLVRLVWTCQNLLIAQYAEQNDGGSQVWTGKKHLTGELTLNFSFRCQETDIKSSSAAFKIHYCGFSVAKHPGQCDIPGLDVTKAAGKLFPDSISACYWAEPLPGLHPGGLKTDVEPLLLLANAYVGQSQSNKQLHNNERISRD